MVFIILIQLSKQGTNGTLVENNLFHMIHLDAVEGVCGQVLGGLLQLSDTGGSGVDLNYLVQSLVGYLNLVVLHAHTL